MSVGPIQTGLLIGALLASAAQPAGRYDSLVRILRPLANLEGIENVRSCLRARSKLDGVSPSSIQLTIHAQSGDIRVTPNPQGCLEIPFDDVLVEENPVVESNQPRGTIELVAQLDVHVDAVQAFDYALVKRMLDSYAQATSRQGMLARAFMPKPTGLLIRVDPNSASTARVSVGTGGRDYAPDFEGVIRIPFNSFPDRDSVRFLITAMPTYLGLDFGG